MNLDLRNTIQDVEILQPVFQHHWLVESWTSITEPDPEIDTSSEIAEFDWSQLLPPAAPIEVDNEILIKQTVSLKVIETPKVLLQNFGLDSYGKFDIVIEEDIFGRVSKAVEVLKTIRCGELRVSVLGPDKTKIKTIVFGGVIVDNHSFNLDYSVSAVLNAKLACSFTSMKFEY